jgi:hypothetical protein
MVTQIGHVNGHTNVSRKKWSNARSREFTQLTCTYIYIHIYIHTCEHMARCVPDQQLICFMTDRHAYVYTYAYIHTYMQVARYAPASATYAYICTYIYAYICIYIYICTHTHTYMHACRWRDMRQHQQHMFHGGRISHTF